MKSDKKIEKNDFTSVNLGKYLGFLNWTGVQMAVL